MMQSFAQLRYTEISRAFRQAPWRVQTQVIATLAAAAVVVVALGGMYLAEASRAATAGRDVQTLQVKKAELELQIDRLQAQIAEAKAVARVEARARELGFAPVQKEQMEFLVVAGYPGAPPPPRAPAAEVPDYDESLGTWVAGMLSSLLRPGG